MTHELPRGVLFDMDDTLFDHAFATRAALTALREREPAFAAWTPEELVQRHSVVLELMHREVLAGRLTIDEARAERFARLVESSPAASSATHRSADLAWQYRDEYERAWRPVPGAANLLAALRRSGAGIAIVTNNLLAEQRLKLERCGLGALVDTLVASSDVGVTKPDAGIFTIALDRLGVARQAAVMVGDVWDTDIAGAQAAGIRPVWFNWRGLPSPDTSVTELRALQPTLEAVKAIGLSTATP